MSTKDNWDDSSDDEEEGGLLRLPPDPPHDEDAYPYEGKDKRYEYEGQFEGDTPPDPLCEPEEEFVDAKATEEGGVGASEADPREEQYEEDEYYSDDDYEDELDDYDKKLGRYVSCR